MTLSENPFKHILCSKFIRSIPNDRRYYQRLTTELDLIDRGGFTQVFLQVLDILELAQGVPHVLRGSAGSSLVCYLLGISNIDPIKEHISLARFMNNYRSDIPDIDIDFPYTHRDEIIDKLKAKYGTRVARISNHVMFREASALREAVRLYGYRRFLPKNFDIFKLFPKDAEQIIQIARNLLGKFRGYSTHCGGVVIFDKPIKTNLLLKPGQIKLNKDQVEEAGLIKIDLLSNRALAQLWQIAQIPLTNYPEFDEQTAASFCRGDVLGITLAESPAMKRLVQAIQPKSRRDIALCLALVRPAAASRGKKFFFLKYWQKYRKKTQIVYDDDATSLIKNLLKISDDEADFYRRGFAKGDEVIMAKFKSLINHLPNANIHMENLAMMKEYSFCKAHAISYSYLVWALAYWKVRTPKRFWHSALIHCQSMYAKWVHVSEAKKAGLFISTIGPNWKRHENILFDPKQTPFLFNNDLQDYQKYNYWLGQGFLSGLTAIKLGQNIRIRGLIATWRCHRENGKDITFVTVGSSLGQYWDLVIEGALSLHGCDVLDVEGEVRNFFNSEYVKVNKIYAVIKIINNTFVPQDIAHKISPYKPIKKALKTQK